MEQVIRSMYEEFVISEAVSKYLSLGTEENSEAQDFSKYIEYVDHARLCRNAANLCSEYFQHKNVSKLLSQFNKLGLYGNVDIIKKKLLLNRMRNK